LSLPTIQRMETSDGLIRGNVDSLTKVVQALEDMGIELIGDGAPAPSEVAACDFVSETSARPDAATSHARSTSNTRL